MDFWEFAGGIRGRGPAAVNVFLGPEAYLREQGVDLLKGAGEDLARNAVRLTASEGGWEAAAAELFTPPFLGGRKLVILSDEGTFAHNHAKQIAEYAASPSPSAVLAVVTPAEKLSGLKEGPALRLIECRPLRPADRTRWVQTEFQRHGKSVDRAAAEALHRRGGEDLATLAGHVANVASYVGGRGRVSVEDVERMVAGHPERKIYELALATAQKQAGKALEIAHALLEAGEAPQQLLWRLAWQYRKLVEAKKLILAGRRPFEVTSFLQITYFPDEFLGLVGGHTLDELLRKHGDILGTDIALKTSGGQEMALMDALVLRLAA